MGEKLKWLMKALDISGIDLAEGIGVDYSTVSKWRTGKRGLRLRSEYVAKIAEFVLSLKTEREGHIVAGMLAEKNPGLNQKDAAAVCQALCLWLTVPDTPGFEESANLGGPMGTFSVRVESTLGIRNLFEAQRRFFKLLRTMEPGQHITVTDFGAVNWSAVDPAMLTDTVEASLEAIRRGNHMTIIDQITELYRPRENMFQFLPLYLHENVTSYFYRDPLPSPLRQNLYLIEGKAALSVSSTASDGITVLTSFYQDPKYVRFFDAVNATVMQDARLMIETMEVRQIHRLLDIIGSHMKSSRLLYMLNRIPTFRNMSQELLQEILQANGIDTPMQESCLLANEKSAATRGRCRCRQIYDLDAIEAQSRRDDFIEYDLTCITGKTVKITRQQFFRQLEYLKENIRDESYALVLYPFSELKMSAPPINVIVQGR